MFGQPVLLLRDKQSYDGRNVVFLVEMEQRLTELGILYDYRFHLIACGLYTRRGNQEQDA
jgi:Fe2+ transport system protein FeoA